MLGRGSDQRRGGSEPASEQLVRFTFVPITPGSGDCMSNHKQRLIVESVQVHHV
ncbi:hypothetical protein J6590_081862 [Homalodisca vitripennis]|nr:hypothetical protein J6590_081862 [Homalodisca vitripennis]